MDFRRFIKILLRVLGHPINSSLSYIAYRHEYRNLSKLYHQFHLDKCLVFDVGANKGGYTKVMLKCGARVVAFEPQPDLVDQLKVKFQNNMRVRIVSKGVSSDGKKTPFNIASSGGHSTFCNIHEKRFSYTSLKEQIVVDTIKLDDAIRTYGKPKFIKIDVEGFEYNVLKGLSKPINLISFEFGHANKKELLKCIKKIDSLGNYLYNYSSSARSLHYNQLFLNKWVKSKELLNVLLRQSSSSGDIYCKLEST